MSTNDRSANAYLRTRALTAPPEELRLMLLEGAVKFAVQGRNGLAARNFEASFNGLSQCRDIIVELITTIRDDVNPEMADRVRAVYTFIFHELTEAGMDKDPVRMEKVIKLLEYERETWEMLIRKLAEERGAGTVPPPRPETRVSFSVQG
jgi:flagellar protein FliS